MPRIDDYINARRLAVKELQAKSLDAILLDSGFKFQEQMLLVPFLDQRYLVSYPDFEFSNASNPGQDVPLQEQVLVLHYLIASPSPWSGSEWVSYREIPGATFYYSAFVKRALDPLKNVFGNEIQGVARAACQLGGNPVDYGDAGYEFYFFPRVPLRLMVWQGDDEFPPSANIIFARGIEEILSPEDIAWMAGMLVYRMIKLHFASQPASGNNQK